MYSAGIIFFEMWQPFSTEMERASIFIFIYFALSFSFLFLFDKVDILNALRARLEFPIGFEAAHPREGISFSLFYFYFPSHNYIILRYHAYLSELVTHSYCCMFFGRMIFLIISLVLSKLTFYFFK